jgi:hypothetical protein
MVAKRKPESSISQEFAGGFLPGLTPQSPPAPASISTPAVGSDAVMTASQQAGKASNQQDANRKKVTLYLDPRHVDLMDELLTVLKRHGLPRDNSMLVRALIDQAQDALADPQKLHALAEACSQTRPKTDKTV